MEWNICLAKFSSVIFSTILAWIFVNTFTNLPFLHIDFDFLQNSIDFSCVKDFFTIFSQQRSNFRMRNFSKEDWNILCSSTYLLYLLTKAIGKMDKFLNWFLRSLSPAQLAFLYVTKSYICIGLSTYLVSKDMTKMLMISG